MRYTCKWLVKNCCLRFNFGGLAGTQPWRKLVYARWILTRQSFVVHTGGRTSFLFRFGLRFEIGFQFLLCSVSALFCFRKLLSHWKNILVIIHISDLGKNITTHTTLKSACNASVWKSETFRHELFLLESTTRSYCL